MILGDVDVLLPTYVQASVAWEKVDLGGRRNFFLYNVNVSELFKVEFGLGKRLVRETYWLVSSRLQLGEIIDEQTQ